MRKILVCAALATTLLAAPAFADNNDTETVTVTGTIVASLELTNNGNITMPDVVLPDSGESTFVTLTCDSAGLTTVTYDAVGGNPYASGTSTNTTTAGSQNVVDTLGNFTGTCADLGVAGAANYNYVATYAVTTATPGTNGTGVTLSAPTCSNAAGALANNATGTLSGAGADTLYCGATVTVADTASAVTYSGAEFTVAVTYD